MERRLIKVGETYEQNGQKKAKWTTIGSLFTNDKGNISIKIDFIPMGWNGYANVFAEQMQTQQAQPQAQPKPKEQELPF